MGKVVKLQDVRMNDLPAVLNDDPWATASEGQRRVAQMREALVLPLVNLVNAGASINHVAKMLVTQVDAGCVDQRTRLLLAQVGREAASVATLKRWISAYMKEGKEGLLPRHTGRVRKDYAWDVRAIELYNLPGKPGYADVASKLAEEGFADVTESRVARFIKSLPATLGKNSPARVGKHLHKLKHQQFQRRHLDDVLVGEIYAGDGHTVDCYVAAPNTGKCYRPELTAFIDIKSRFIAGWWLSESETKESTLFALSHSMVVHDHVPAWLYLDRGAGYRAEMLSDESTGWYAKFNIAVIGAIPGNPHGKGWIERWFRTLRDKHDKFFGGGQVYCGDDMAPEINRRLSSDLNSGKRKLPSLAQYTDSLTRWIDHYHNSPMDALQGRTPAQVWAELTRVPVELDHAAVVRPRQEVHVVRETTTLHKRTYWHGDLTHFNGTKLVAEYSLHDDKFLWLYTAKGQFVCQAKLIKTIGGLPISRLEEQRDKRLAGQLARRAKHAQEALARRNDPITADEQLGAIGAYQDDALPEPRDITPLALSAPEPNQPDTPAADDADWDLDITSWKDND